jgi:hypothetical protein
VTISDHSYSEVRSALREVNGCGASLVFARAVGSLWRTTPQAGQRASCAGLSLYGFLSGAAILLVAVVWRTGLSLAPTRVMAWTTQISRSQNL